MRKHFWKGLKAIDFILLFLMIGILGIIVIPRYEHYRCRSMQSEARFSLQEIYAAQQLYFAQHSFYAPMETLLKEGRVVLPKKNYQFSDVKKPHDNEFLIAAHGLFGTSIAGEQWTINHHKELVLLKAVCGNQ